MVLFFYQAECGDAARISYVGNDGKPHNIFIDSGYEKTYSHIISEDIKTLINENEFIDLWIVSHIHNDHIGGVLRYLKSVNSGEVIDLVKTWYYNAPRHDFNERIRQSNKSVSSAVSISQGDELFEYLKNKNLLLNFDITCDLEIQNLFGLKLTILSPTIDKLNNLRQKYEESKFLDLEKNEVESVSKAVSVKGHDFHIKLESFDLYERNEEDLSVENGSSISVITELNNNKVLWLSDCHPSDVVNSLKKLGFSKDNQLVCNWVKIAHHGSKANNSNELYDLIKCNNYLLSVNGENMYYLPAKEALARIIRNKNRPTDSFYSFYFTYDNPTLRNIFQVDGDSVFDKWKFKVEYLNNNKYVKVVV